MASKTVWIVGGLVVAIGVVAYVAFKPAPATDASGTIVEAKRARADGTNSFNPSPTASTTDQSASDASKAMAGPDAAKDAAGAAGEANSNIGRPHAVERAATQAADASKAAGGDNSDIRNKMARERATASEAADAETAQRAGPNYRNQRVNQQATLKSSNNAPEMSK